LEIGSGDPAISVEFHTGHTTDDAPNWDYCRKQWEDYPPDIIPISLDAYCPALEKPQRRRADTYHQRLEDRVRRRRADIH